MALSCTTQYLTHIELITGVLSTGRWGLKACAEHTYEVLVFGTRVTEDPPPTYTTNPELCRLAE